MRVEITTDPYREFRNKFLAEKEYIFQTSEWRSGMRYRYSPEDYPISKEQLKQLKEAGSVVGRLLEKSFPDDTFIEFRIDFVANSDGKFYATEIQTDDRGLPVMANVRNIRPTINKEKFPGVIKTFASSLKELSGKTNPSLLIVFPEEESFYYSNMADFALLLAAEGVETIPASDNFVTNGNEGAIKIRVPYDNLVLTTKPDFIWNFSNQVLQGARAIQPIVDKTLIVDKANMEFIPKTVLVNNTIKNDLLKNKNDWVIKPISGRWSKGIVFGNSVSSEEWEKTINGCSEVIAQQFVPPRKERFYAREKDGDFTLEFFFARVEGYYIKNQKTGEWEIADVMATCTKELPVRGKRDCIMIPGEVVSQI